MLVAIALLMLVLWMLGFVVFKTAGAIHLLFVVAIVLICIRFI